MSAETDPSRQPIHPSPVHHELAKLFASDKLIGPPLTEKVTELMAIMFSPEEAAVALHVPPFLQKPTAKIASRANLPESETERLLNAMADRRVIHRGRKGYSLIPLVPGVFERILMGRDEGDFHHEVARRVKELFGSGYMRDHVGTPTQVVRAIPVDRSIAVSSLAIDSERISAMIEAHDDIAVLHNCQCRQAAKMGGDPCKKANVSDGCLVFGSFARFFVEEGGARYVTGDEMKRVAQERWDRQLVLFGGNVSPESPNLICTCCDCCCLMLEGLIKPAPKILITPPAFLVEVDEELCDDCGRCLKACNTDAHKLEAKKHTFDVELCVGCGLCIMACPEAAIRPVANARHKPPAKSFGHLAVKLAPSKVASVLEAKAKRSEMLSPLFERFQRAARGLKNQGRG